MPAAEGLHEHCREKHRGVVEVADAFFLLRGPVRSFPPRGVSESLELNPGPEDGEEGKGCQESKTQGSCEYSGCSTQRNEDLLGQRNLLAVGPNLQR